MAGGRSRLAEIGLHPGESVMFSIRGRCMPGVAPRARVCRQRWYVPGDVVVVRRRDYFDAHRFLGYAPSRHGVVALTRADDAAEPDPAATADAIVGRADHPVRIKERFRAVRWYAHAIQRRLRTVLA